MSGTATLSWSSDVGFTLDLSADLEGIRLRFAGVPVPADGTVELGQGVELNKIDILFKCQAVIDGAQAQLQDATITVAGGELKLEAHLEDVEQGLLYPLEASFPCPLPPGVPERGGVRNLSPEEDELDWGDETTFEAVVGDIPDATLLTEEFGEPDPPEEKPAPSGVAALLAALKNLPDDEELPEENDDAPFTAPPPDPGDQKMSPQEEARAFLEVLLGRDALEMEEGFDLDVLVPEVSRILRLPTSDTTKAERLSAWLLEQEAVADLYVDDETLAAIVAQW